MMLRATTAAAVLAVLAAVAPAASAGTVQVGSPGALTASPLTLEDFEDDVFVSGVTFVPGFRVTHAGASGGVGPSGIYGWATSPGPMVINFDAPIHSFGAWIGNDEFGGFDAVLSLYDAGGLVTTLSLAVNGNDWADQFIGFNTTEDITSVQLDYGNSLAEYVDDVYFGSGVVVPLPPAAFLGLGLLGGLGLIGRLRRRRSN